MELNSNSIFSLWTTRDFYGQLKQDWWAISREIPKIEYLVAELSMISSKKGKISFGKSTEQLTKA